MNPTPARPPLRTPPSPAAPLLLALALLLGQVGLVAHATDHGLYAEDGACVVCIQAQAPAAGAAAAPGALPERAVEAPATGAGVPSAARPLPTYGARAPPQPVS